MKKKLTALLAVMLLLISTTFANGRTGPSLQLQTEFNRLFTEATAVQWQDVSGLYRATFKQGDEYLTAFFNPSGTLESVSRNITPKALPLILQKGLHKKLSTSWVSESFELLGKNGTEYYVTLEDANSKAVYQAASNDWTLYKKTKK